MSWSVEESDVFLYLIKRRRFAIGRVHVIRTLINVHQYHNNESDRSAGLRTVQDGSRWSDYHALCPFLHICGPVILSISQLEPRLDGEATLSIVVIKSMLHRSRTCHFRALQHTSPLLLWKTASTPVFVRPTCVLLQLCFTLLSTLHYYSPRLA